MIGTGEDEIADSYAPYLPATIALSATSISQTLVEGQRAAAETFQIWNGGSGTMSYSITPSVPWLAVSASTGSSTGEQDSISVFFNSSILTAGTYSGILNVFSEEVTKSPQTLLVSLVITKPPVATSGVARLAWDPVTTNADGSAVTSPRSYRIYYGMSSRAYTHHTDVGMLTTGTVTGLRTDSRYYFAVTTLDPMGLESDYSEEIWWRAPTALEVSSVWGAVDNDEDGMPDAWETGYFPDRQAQAIDPAVDADGDGRSNLDEFIAGTDPSVADAEPMLEIAGSSEGLPIIMFQTRQATGTGYAPKTRFYAVECCPDLDRGLWTAQPGLEAIEASPEPVVIEADPTVASEARCWRIRAWLQ